jgi:hypothetical protein
VGTVGEAVLATLNGLLSQPIAAFPDGMIPRHEGFVFIAAGNTTGAGADMKFVGRNQLDGATLDRFVFVFWEIDEDYEIYVAGDDQREWTHYVQKCRRAAASCGVTENVVFATPRASINGARALRRGKLSRSPAPHPTGHLFFDGSHKPCTGRTPHGSSRRVSAWEIHSLYAIEVCINTSISGSRGRMRANGNHS